MQYDIQWGPRDELRVTYTGHMDRAFMDRVDAVINSDARFDSVKRALYDFSGVTSADTDHNDAEELAYIDAVAGAYKTSLKCAYVAPPDPALQQLLYYYVTILEGLNKSWAHRIFDDRSEAERWLAGA